MPYQQLKLVSDTALYKAFLFIQFIVIEEKKSAPNVSLKVANRIYEGQRQKIDA